MQGVAYGAVPQGPPGAVARTVDVRASWRIGGRLRHATYGCPSLVVAVWHCGEREAAPRFQLANTSTEQDNANPTRWLTRFNSRGSYGGRPRGGRMRDADRFGSGEHRALPIACSCQGGLDAGAGFHSPRRVHRSAYLGPSRCQGRVGVLRSERSVREQRSRRRNSLVNRTGDGRERRERVYLRQFR